MIDQVIQVYQIVIISLCLGIGLMVVGYWPLLRWAYETRKRQDEARKKLIEQTGAILDRAQVEAQQLLDDARARIDQDLSQITAVEGEAENFFKTSLESTYTARKKSLDEATERLLGEYKSSLDQTKTAEIESLKTVTDSATAATQQLFSELRETIKQDLSLYLTTHQEELKKTNALTRQQLDDYQNYLRSRLQEQVYAVLAILTEDILGKSLSFTEQKDLVMRCLDRVFPEHGTN